MSDRHAETAAIIFSVRPEDVTDEQRRVAKTINLGRDYGMGEHLAQKVLKSKKDKKTGMTREERIALWNLRHKTAPAINTPIQGSMYVQVDIHEGNAQAVKDLWDYLQSQAQHDTEGPMQSLIVDEMAQIAKEKARIKYAKSHQKKTAKASKPAKVDPRKEVLAKIDEQAVIPVYAPSPRPYQHPGLMPRYDEKALNAVLAGVSLQIANSITMEAMVDAARHRSSLVVVKKEPSLADDLAKGAEDFAKDIGVDLGKLTGKDQAAKQVLENHYGSDQPKRLAFDDFIKSNRFAIDEHMFDLAGNMFRNNDDKRKEFVRSNPGWRSKAEGAGVVFKHGAK